MTRFFGRVGYVKEPIRTDGVVRNVIEERPYYGDEKRMVRYFNTGDSVNGKVSVRTTRLEIMADAYALENFQDIRYVEWAGTFWEVDTVEPERPRLTLVLGERYTGPVKEESDDESP